MSARRAGEPLISYSLPPERNMVREICTRSAGMLRVPSELSKVRVTLARPRGARWAPSPEPASPEPAKMTSFMLPPRRLLAPCSPITQASASNTLDLPEPLGPTTALMPGVNSKVVAEAKDLNPRRVSDIRCTRGLSAEELVCAGHVLWCVAASL